LKNGKSIDIQIKHNYFVALKIFDLLDKSVDKLLDD